MEENRGKEGKKGTLQEAVVDSGYSESYARRGGIKESKAWSETLEEAFPDDYLAEHHKQLMTAHKIESHVFPGSEDDSSIMATIESFGFKVMKIRKQGDYKRAYFPIINDRAKKDALDMAYKLKKRYDNTITIKGAISQLSSEEIEDRISERVSGALRSLAGAASEGTAESG